MPIPFIFALAAGIGIAVAAYLILPKPKLPKPAAAQDLESPTSEAGRPMPVPFGSITVKGVNILGSWDKELVEREVKV